MLKTLKRVAKPFLLPPVQRIEKLCKQLKTFEVPLEKLLQGGENGIRAYKYAELTNNFTRPSTLAIYSPHTQLLQRYDEIGDKVIEEAELKKTAYYKNALECMQLTGAYFYDRPEEIKTLASRFINQYKGIDQKLPPQPGQSGEGEPIWVRPIKHSSYFEVIDGHHRIALASMRNQKTIQAYVYEEEPALTPLQQVLLDCLWTNKQKWLYQPIDFPEISEEWSLIRKCTDRFEMIQKFLSKHSKTKGKNYIDIGSSYGWFVKQMESLGLKTFGMERDPVGIDIGCKIYSLSKSQIIHKDIVRGLEEMKSKGETYAFVSCFSVLHHFALGKSSTSAEDLIRLLDEVTGEVLFFDTGEEHEEAFEGTLDGWNPDYIEKWIKENTRFKSVVALGKDTDRVPPFETYYGRTLFACSRK